LIILELIHNLMTRHTQDMNKVRGFAKR
jgi:hypothetical protein